MTQKVDYKFAPVTHTHSYSPPLDKRLKTLNKQSIYICDKKLKPHSKNKSGVFPRVPWRFYLMIPCSVSI